MLRRANDDETAAFDLVERTVQRTRPQVGALGLKALDVPGGRIERNPLGLLRFRLDGNGSPYAPDNPLPARRLSAEENALWDSVDRVLAVTIPIVDSEWNLVSMRLGQRSLQRLPFGSVVTNHPPGTPPFRGTLALPKPPSAPERIPEDERVRALFEAIEAFVAQGERPRIVAPALGDDWRRHAAPYPVGGSRAAALLSRGHHRARGKWHKCPICRAPVARGPYNPRIAPGTIRIISAPIRDLRGGYLSLLRDTYIVDGPTSVFDAGEPRGTARTFTGTVEARGEDETL